MSLQSIFFTTPSVILAQGANVAAKAESAGLSESQRKSLVIGGIAFAAVITMFAMMALFTRRRKHRRHRRHERSHERHKHEEHRSESSESGERSHRHRRRSRSSEKYKMNPTLSETGGLPPIRPDDQLPKY